MAKVRAEKTKIKVIPLADAGRAGRCYAGALSAQETMGKFTGDGLGSRVRRFISPVPQVERERNATVQRGKLDGEVRRQCAQTWYTKGFFRSQEMTKAGVTKDKYRFWRDVVGELSLGNAIKWMARRERVVAVYRAVTEEERRDRKRPKRPVSGREIQEWHAAHGLGTTKGPNLGLKLPEELRRLSSRALRLSGSLVTNPHAEQPPASPRQGERPRRVIKER